MAVIFVWCSAGLYDCGNLAAYIEQRASGGVDRERAVYFPELYVVCLLWTEPQNAVKVCASSETISWREPYQMEKVRCSAYSAHGCSFLVLMGDDTYRTDVTLIVCSMRYDSPMKLPSDFTLTPSVASFLFFLITAEDQHSQPRY